MRPYRGEFLPHDRTRRTEFIYKECQTTAYPSAGGIVIGFFAAVELQYLEIPNLKPTNRSQDPGEEDNLAMRMMSLGVHWWPNWDLYAYHKSKINSNYIYDFHFPPRVNVGYPSSGEGAWILKFSEDTQVWEEWHGRKSCLPAMPDEWEARIHMALTMDERCELLQEYGAKFYVNKDDCEEDLPKTLDEGMQRGKQYEVLLNKMEDQHYLDKWLCGPGEDMHNGTDMHERENDSFKGRMMEGLCKLYQKCQLH